VAEELLAHAAGAYQVAVGDAGEAVARSTDLRVDLMTTPDGCGIVRGEEALEVPWLVGRVNHVAGRHGVPSCEGDGGTGGDGRRKNGRL
jgi:hypothetical protein